MIRVGIGETRISSAPLLSSVLMSWLAVALCRLFSMGLVKEGVDMEEGTLEIGMGESQATRSKLAYSVRLRLCFVMMDVSVCTVPMHHWY